MSESPVVIKKSPGGTVLVAELRLGEHLVAGMASLLEQSEANAENEARWHLAEAVSMAIRFDKWPDADGVFRA